MWRVSLRMLLIGALAVPPVQESPVRDMDVWLAAVRQHQPGALDAPARDIARWPWADLSPVLRSLRARVARTDLLRGAVLYLDIVAHLEPEQRPLYPTGGRVFMSNDGRSDGIATLDSHVWAARHIVRAAVRQRDVSESDRADVAAWYRTVAAWMGARSSLADLQPLLDEALREFPDHPGLLFDHGCLQEMFAQPSVQAAVAETSRPPVRAGVPRQIPSVRSAADHLESAARDYRKALALDPSLVEARARLAHVLTDRGRPADALAVLEGAQDRGGDPMLDFYIHLFRGRALAAAGRGDEAIASMRRAAALFPEARSPQLTISFIEAEGGRTGTAREIIASALGRGVNDDSDPWWVYRNCTGRNAAGLHRAFAERMAGRLR